MYLCVHLYMNLCMYLCMYVCTYVYIYVYQYVQACAYDQCQLKPSHHNICYEHNQRHSQLKNIPVTFFVSQMVFDADLDGNDGVSYDNLICTIRWQK